jgi:DNA mismatch repair protein MutH
MEREVAMLKFAQLIGQDLRPLADKYEVTVFAPNGKKNKGWAGHVAERFLGLPLNSSRAPNFGSWELKVVPFKYLRDGTIVPKETMAITMIDPVEVAQKEFTESHLYTKLKKQIILGRFFVNQEETASTVYGVKAFDLGDAELFRRIEADYNLIRQAILEGKPLSGSMGELIQPRTKGAGGDAPKTRAFYARIGFLASVFNSEFDTN